MAAGDRDWLFREHLDWGYVDNPPLIVLIAWVTRHTLGTSFPALIFWPAMAGVGRILLVAALARALGAQSFETAFAAFVTSLAPVWIAIDHQFAMKRPRVPVLDRVRTRAG